MTKIYQFKITIARSKPPIWRRVLVPSSFTLKQFHEVIQSCFDWYGYHLYAFNIYGEMFDDERPRSLSKKLDKLNLAIKEKFQYYYDFGDDWIHDIVLENILPDDGSKNFPCCIAGKRAAPPEDSGGIWGYEDKLEILKNKNHPEYDEISEWMPVDFEPEVFSMQHINEQLKHMLK